MYADNQATDLLNALQGHDYLRLTTFRKTGAPVATPVWFAIGNDNIYMFSLSSAGKLKRIRHTPRVLVAPCTAGGKPLGPDVEARAYILPAAQWRMADQFLERKYGWQLAGLKLMYRLQGSKRVFVEIQIVHD